MARRDVRDERCRDGAGVRRDADQRDGRDDGATPAVAVADVAEDEAADEDAGHEGGLDDARLVGGGAHQLPLRRAEGGR